MAPASDTLFGARARKAGQLVQVDHMTYARDGQTLKESANRRFDAVCPVSRFMVARVYTRATAGRTLWAKARDAF